MARILIVEDDITFCNTLKGFLGKQGYSIDIIHTIKGGIELIQRKKYQLLLLDFRLPDGTGADLLNFIKADNVNCPVIIMTSFIDVKTAVSMIKLGAKDYITKPVIPEELLMIISEVFQKKNINPEQYLNIPYIEGTSEKSKKLKEHIKIVAPTNLSIIIQGESGTGKEQIARQIHGLSQRASSTFAAIDCGTLSSELAASELFGHALGAFTGAVTEKKGQFELADGGTLLLDEIGNLSYEVQIKLLRFLQERVILPVGSHKKIAVDVRIIAASNDDLTMLVRDGNFRVDLYHRLNEFKIDVPALRHRREDLNLFIEHFISVSNHELGKNVKTVSNEVLQIFANYAWPGNLRELKNIIKRAVLLSKDEVLEKDLLPQELILEVNANPEYSEFDLKARQEVNEREMIMKTLQQVKFNKSKAARLLNIDRTTLYLKLVKYNIEH